MESVRIPTTCLVTTKSSAKVNQYSRVLRLHFKHGVSEVTLCNDEALKKVVVLKAVKRNSAVDKVKTLRRKSNNDPPSSQQSISREIAILKALRHPNIGQLLEVIDDPSKDTVYIVLEHLSGGPVEWEDKGSPILSEDQARRVVRDVIVALEFLHYHGVIHRDIKPSNLIYDCNRSRVKLIDFGISHFSESRVKIPRAAAFPKDMDYMRQSSSFKETDLLKVRGTGYFYSPEVIWFPPDASPCASSDSILSQYSPTLASAFMTRPPITEAVDIWSCGVTLYCFLFGRFPFNPPNEGRGSSFALNREILERDWFVPETMCSERIPTGGAASRSISGHVVNILHRMLQKDPAQRIELSEVKNHSWILEGIPDHQTWISLTSPIKLYHRPPWFRRSLSVIQGMLPTLGRQ